MIFLEVRFKTSPFEGELRGMIILCHLPYSPRRTSSRRETKSHFEEQTLIFQLLVLNFSVFNFFSFFQYFQISKAQYNRFTSVMWKENSCFFISSCSFHFGNFSFSKTIMFNIIADFYLNICAIVF